MNTLRQLALFVFILSLILMCSCKTTEDIRIPILQDVADVGADVFRSRTAGNVRKGENVMNNNTFTLHIHDVPDDPKAASAFAAGLGSPFTQHVGSVKPDLKVTGGGVAVDRGEAKKSILEQWRGDKDKQPDEPKKE